jgi:hypothetical protein
MEELKYVKLIFEILKERLPQDCSFLVDEYKKKFIEDIKNFGLNNAIKKWYYEDNDELKVD